MGVPVSLTETRLVVDSASAVVNISLAIHFSSERVADANADANDEVALEAEPLCAAAAAAAIAPLAPPLPLPPRPASRWEIDAIMTAESFSMIIPLSTVSSIAISTISRFSIMERRSICPLRTRRRYAVRCEEGFDVAECAQLVRLDSNDRGRTGASRPSSRRKL